MLGGSDLQTQRGARPAGSNTETRGVGQTAPTRRDYRTLLASCPQPCPPSSWGKELSLASISGGGAPLDDVVGGAAAWAASLGTRSGPGDDYSRRSPCAGLEVRKVEAGSCSESRADRKSVV